jgi:hypothetical protein
MLNKHAGENPPTYPNGLREKRDAVRMSRDTLSRICGRLSIEDDARFTTVSYFAIRQLEMGKSRPRARTAATLTAALGISSDEQIWESGIDNVSRNPEGRTGTNAGRPKNR